MAEFMLVDSARHLVPLGELDPVQNVSLTDAGLTPYHAIKNAISSLGAGTSAVVIGTGGLGHVGIQIHRAITGATVIALDVNDEKLELARAVGAHHTLLSNDDAPDAIKQLTGGRGASAVFDFVGAAPTVRIAAAAAASEAHVSIVGIGGGQLPVGFGSTAFDVSVRAPYWGSRSELIEVLELARRGQVKVEVETFSLDEAPRAYQLLHDGKIRGRAVVIPNS
jgi:propanol-preferring alcohol dehydrogenase